MGGQSDIANGDGAKRMSSWWCRRRSVGRAPEPRSLGGLQTCLKYWSWRCGGKGRGRPCPAQDRAQRISNGRSNRRASYRLLILCILRPVPILGGRPRGVLHITTLVSRQSQLPGGSGPLSTFVTRADHPCDYRMHLGILADSMAPPPTLRRAG